MTHWFSRNEDHLNRSEDGPAGHHNQPHILLVPCGRIILTLAGLSEYQCTGNWSCEYQCTGNWSSEYQCTGNSSGVTSLELCFDPGLQNTLKTHLSTSCSLLQVTLNLYQTPFTCIMGHLRARPRVIMRIDQLCE